MAVSENLEKLEIITPLLGNMVSSQNGGWIEYDSNGTIIGINLYRSEEVAVQRAFMAKGTLLPIHCHDSREWIMVYRGKVCFAVGSDKHVVEIGHSIMFDPGVEHSAEALDNSWVIGVVIPDDEGYPGD